MQNSQHGNLKNNPKYPKRYKTEEFTLFEGDVRLYRVNASGDVWQFSTWISQEKKYFRKSLRTKDRELAQERARELFYEIQGKYELVTNCSISPFGRLQTGSSRSSRNGCVSVIRGVGRSVSPRDGSRPSELS